ncbi:MAG: Flp family type IVb pilin [Actinobacteria bacterium]|nr:MAG: Flp family type IVb pilin [Actinomycetota bacterium]
MYAWALEHSKSDEGATAVEYGIMVAAIAVAILTVVFLLGDQIAALFQTVLDKIAGA